MGEGQHGNGQDEVKGKALKSWMHQHGVGQGGGWGKIRGCSNGGVEELFALTAAW